MSSTVIQLVIAGICTLISFVASVWGNAISRLTGARAERLKEQSGKAGGYLVQIAANPRPYVASALLVMLLARVTATVLITAMLVRRGVPMAELIAVVALTFVIFQVVELAPRTWILERPDQVMLFSARPVFYVGRVLIPLSVLMVRINRLFLLVLPGRGVPRGPLTSEEEIKSIIDVAEEEEVIETREREMLHSVFEFGDTIVREVMVPRPDMVCVDSTSSLEEVVDLALKKGFSRFPVITESIDNVAGVIHLKDVIKRTRKTKKLRTASDVAREAHFVPESKKVAELLNEMRGTQTHMMVVVDEYGGVSGLVTLEDLLEEIVGEISDEYDREEPSVIPLDGNNLLVDATLPIDELNDLLDAKFPHTEWDSVGGLVGGTLGRVARQGDEVKVDGINFQVERMKGRRIAKVLVSPPAEIG